MALLGSGRAPGQQPHRRVACEGRLDVLGSLAGRSTSARMVARHRLAGTARQQLLGPDRIPPRPGGASHKRGEQPEHHAVASAIPGRIQAGRDLGPGRVASPRLRQTAIGNSQHKQRDARRAALADSPEQISAATGAGPDRVRLLLPQGRLLRPLHRQGGDHPREMAGSPEPEHVAQHIDTAVAL